MSEFPAYRKLESFLRSFDIRDVVSYMRDELDETPYGVSEKRMKRIFRRILLDFVEREFDFTVRRRVSREMEVVLNRVIRSLIQDQRASRFTRRDSFDMNKEQVTQKVVSKVKDPAFVEMELRDVDIRSLGQELFSRLMEMTSGEVLKIGRRERVFINDHLMQAANVTRQDVEEADLFPVVDELRVDVIDELRRIAARMDVPFQA